MIELIQGDCFQEVKNISDKYVDYTFTSPPYNRKRNDKYKNYNDIMENYFQWLCDIIDELLRVTKKHVIFNIQKTYYNKSDVFKLFGKYSDKIQEVFIWEKSNPMPASGMSITNAYEFFIILGDQPVKSNNTYTKNVLTTAVNSDMPKNHKAVMKQEVSDWFIDNLTEENTTILDPFMGLGTTGISCKKLDRNFIGIELDKDYFKIATDKIEKHQAQLTLL